MEPSPNDTLHSHITQELKTTTVTPTHYKASEVSLCLPYVHLGNVSKVYVTVYGGVVEADVEGRQELDSRRLLEHLEVLLQEWRANSHTEAPDGHVR